jgi:Ca2+/Na+ antiporter
MSAPVPSGSRNARRERLVGLLVLGVALVLLVSSPTWFASDRAVVGIGQLVLGVVLAAIGGFLVRRSGRA